MTQFDSNKIHYFYTFKHLVDILAYLTSKPR